MQLGQVAMPSHFRRRWPNAMSEHCNLHDPWYHVLMWQVTWSQSMQPSPSHAKSKPNMQYFMCRDCPSGQFHPSYLHSWRRELLYIKNEGLNKRITTTVSRVLYRLVQSTSRHHKERPPRFHCQLIGLRNQSTAEVSASHPQPKCMSHHHIIQPSLCYADL